MHSQPSKPYRGRFAPSPTGPLHFGSLVTALGSFLQARSQHGEWLVRLEDIDPPREQPGATDDILHTLEAFHLFWDGEVLFQSTRAEAYEAALAQLGENGLSFACGCSRKTIAENGGGMVYPGTCRDGLPEGATPRAIRVRVADQRVAFDDLLQGRIETELQIEVGDFVVRRADGFYAYHLAVVVDDAEQGITEIIRGTDLLSSTPPQNFLQHCLGYSQPQYGHLPIAVNEKGQKLSKQTFAAPIYTRNPGPVLEKALRFLSHPVPVELETAPPAVLLEWAVTHWDIQSVPHTKAIYAEK